MARRKAAKPVKVKRNVKKQSKQFKTSLIDTIEKSFKGMPSQLIAQCRKELATLNQQEKKLSVELKKAMHLGKAIQDKCTALAKATMTAKVKKQLAAAKKGLEKAHQVIKAMSSKSDSLNNQINTIKAKQAKFTAIAKELSQFDKEWRAPAPVKKKPVKASKKAASKVKKESSIYTSPVTESMMNTTEMAQTEAENHEPVDTTTY